jgi:hypothetical protein
MVIFDLTQPVDNWHRYYYVSWQTDLFGKGTVVRVKCRTSLYQQCAARLYQRAGHTVGPAGGMPAG